MGGGGITKSSRRFERTTSLSSSVMLPRVTNADFLSSRCLHLRTSGSGEGCRWEVIRLTGPYMHDQCGIETVRKLMVCSLMRNNPPPQRRPKMRAVPSNTSAFPTDDLKLLFDTDTKCRQLLHH